MNKKEFNVMIILLIIIIIMLAYVILGNWHYYTVSSACYNHAINNIMCMYENGTLTSIYR